MWVIPMEIESRYVIDPTDGSIIKEEGPWFAFLGKIKAEFNFFEAWPSS